MVFFGEYQVSSSAPGRILLPKKLRELLKGNTFVLTRGFDSCLAGYDRQDWESRSQALMTVSLLERDNIEKRRSLFSSAVYSDIDDQGRFVIPKHLLSFAGISEKAMVVGVGDHFEIWEPAKWNAYIQSNS